MPWEIFQSTLGTCSNTTYHTWIRLGAIPPSPPFHFHASLNTYTTYTWKTTHLVKLWHSSLPRYLWLFLTSRQVGLKPIANFPSGPRPCRPRLSSPVFWPNHRLCLVWGLSVPRPTPQAPFLKPSLVDTYATHESSKLWVKPSPRLRLTTQVTARASCGGPDLGPN
jgi:hypothetical protein